MVMSCVCVCVCVYVCVCVCVRLGGLEVESILHFHIFPERTSEDMALQALQTNYTTTVNHYQDIIDTHLKDVAKVIVYFRS